MPAALTQAEFEFTTVTVDAAGAVTTQRSGRVVRYRQALSGGVGLDLVRVPGGQGPIGSPRGVGYDDEYP